MFCDLLEMSQNFEDTIVLLYFCYKTSFIKLCYLIDINSNTKPHFYLEMGLNSSHNALHVFKDFTRSNCQSTRQAKIESTPDDSK